jgi:DNA topoisomerase VI subunit A
MQQLPTMAAVSAAPEGLAVDTCASIEALALRLLRRILREEDPCIEVAGMASLLASSSGGSYAGARDLASLLKVLRSSYELLARGKHATSRELYYLHATFFSDQSEANAAVVRAASTLNVPRHGLGIVAAGRGWYHGCLRVREHTGSAGAGSVAAASGGSVFDGGVGFSGGGTAFSTRSGIFQLAASSGRDHGAGADSPVGGCGGVGGAGAAASQPAGAHLSPFTHALQPHDGSPSATEPAAAAAVFDREGAAAVPTMAAAIERAVYVRVLGGPPRAVPAECVFAPLDVVDDGARFVLVVEKECIFRRMVEDGVAARQRCVIVTGCGMPDVATRAFVHQLHTRLGLPVLGLSDWNPYGMGIMLCYRNGSKATPDANAFKVPLRWLGLRNDDVESFGLPSQSLQPMTGHDEAKAASLLRDPFVAGDDAWAYEAECFLAAREKMELEGALAVSLDFLANTYLPWKLEADDAI